MTKIPRCVQRRLSSIKRKELHLNSRILSRVKFLKCGNLYPTKVWVGLSVPAESVIDHPLLLAAGGAVAPSDSRASDSTASVL